MKKDAKKEVVFIDSSKALEKKSPALVYEDRSLNINRLNEVGIVSETTNSSVSIKKDGEVSLSSHELSQFRLNETKSMAVSQEHHGIHNRMVLNTDEIIINDHKLNPQLIELSDTRVLFSDPKEIIGNFMMDGTVMVKAWDQNLNKYVLIRRRIRTPMFSYKLNQPIIPDQLNLKTGVITAVDLDAAILIKQEEKSKNKVVLDEHAAEGGTNYDQGEYNNYTSDFTYGDNSITSQGGMTSGSSDQSTTESTEVSPTGPPSFVDFDTSLEYIWPVPTSFKITSQYGARWGTWHNGIDIAPSDGTNTNIVAAADGIVVAVKYENVTESGTGYKDYGRLVHIGHDNQTSTIYAHLDKIDHSVKQGGRVKKGQIIGKMGSTGYSTGVHLHFGACKDHSPMGFIKSNGKLINPNTIVKPQN